MNADLALAELVEINATYRRDLRPCRDGRDALKQWRVEVDRRARVGAIGVFSVFLDIECEFEAHRPRTRTHRIDPRDQ